MHQLEKEVIAAIPCKGNGNVLGKCVKDGQKLASENRRIFAVLDQDKLGELLKLKGTPCLREVLANLADRCDAKESIEFVFIKKNLESVIEAIRDSDVAGFVRAEIFERALNKKELAARDSLFCQFADNTKDVREKLLELKGLEDVKRLVVKLVQAASRT